MGVGFRVYNGFGYRVLGLGLGLALTLGFIMVSRIGFWV